jgi:hypothetical protein
MKPAQLAVYNFLANKLGLHQYPTLAALEYAVREGTCDKRCLSVYNYSVVDINTKEVVSALWAARDYLEWVKVRNGVVTEHYRRFPATPKTYFKSYDLITGELIEYYSLTPTRSIKIDAKTDEVKGFTTFSSFENLPEEYKNALVDYTYKGDIFGWSDRNYGKIVYVNKEELS